MAHIHAQHTKNHEKRQAIACRRVSAGSALVVETALSNLKTIATRCHTLAVMAVMLLFGSVAWGQTTITLSNSLTQGIQCGTTYNFYDSGGPTGNYSTSQNYTATFTSEGDIIINFSQFVTESSTNCNNWDYIEIYDGNTSGTLLVIGQTGCSSRSLMLNHDYTATSGTMTVVWHSDGTTVAAGWAATITATGCPPTPCTPTLTSTTTTYYISRFQTTGASTNIDNTTSGAGHSYSDFYNSVAAIAVAGSTIGFTITIAGGSTHGSAIWVDWNRNGTFEDGERVWHTTSYTSSPHTNSFAIPNDAEGSYRMRVVSDCYGSNPSNPCSASTGEFEDYKLIVAEPTINMSSNMSQVIECGSNWSFYDSGGPTGNYSTSQNYTATFTSEGDIVINFSQFVTESSTNCNNWDYIEIYDGNTSGTLLVIGQTDCSSRSLMLNHDYTATSGTMTVVWHSDGTTVAAGWAATITATGCPPCTPTLTSTTTTYYISRFQTTGASTNIDNTTSGAGHSYSDFYNSVAAVAVAGSTIGFTITIAGGGTHGSAIWVDWNRNGTFEDGERVWHTTSYTYSPHTNSFVIPNEAEGNYRMRIVSDYNGNNPSNPCSASTGEFEDYKLTVTASSSCPTTIASLADWNAFCGCVNSGHSYDGETVTLTANVSGVTQMAGTSSTNSFKGTFDGQGHTLNVNISSSEQGASPFRYIAGATIKDLKVTGTVTSTEHHASGLVGFCADGSTNTIRNCLVSTNVTNNNTYDGDAGNNYMGGIIGHNKGATTSIIGCVYDGTLTSQGFKGGMIGFADPPSPYTATVYITVTDSYFAGNYSSNGYGSPNFSPVAIRAGHSFTFDLTSSNFYYNTDAGAFSSDTYSFENNSNKATHGTPKHAYSVTGDGCVTVALAPPATTYNVSGIVAYSPGIRYVGANGTIYGGDGDNMNLILGCTNGAVESYSSDHGALSGSATSGSNDPYTLAMTANNTVISAVESSCPITVINNTADWNAFCTCVNNGYDYNGQTVNLMANISVTTMAGNLGHPFRGTFEGNEHTITVDYTANYPDNSDHFTAPFICTDGATIQNLRIDGTINMGGFNYGSGLIGEAHGNNIITNCVSNVTINSSRSDDGTMGGFIVRNYGQYPAGSNEGTTTFNGCSFTGSLNGTNTYNCAGFVAWDEYVNWSEGGHYGKVVFNDCLFAPTAVTMSTTGSATFSRYRDDSKVTLNNSYYFQSFGTIQGKQAYSVTGIDGVTVDRNNVTATYSVSGITAYSTGIKYNSVFYGGDGDVLSLILNYGGSDFCGYAADYGSLSTSNPDGTDDPGNLTMVAHNTQISPATCFSVPICFDFNSESYSTTPSDDSGLPQGWGRVYSGTEPGYAPHVILNSPAFSCDGSRSILMAAIGAPAATMGTTSIVILPRVTGITTGTEITFTYKFQSDGGRLRLGYMNGGTFVSLKEIATSTTCADDSYTLTAAEAAEIEGNNRRLAFEWFYNTNTTARFVVIDDVCINAPVCDTVNVGDHSVNTTNSYLPSYNFYDYSLSQQIYTPCEIGKAGTLTSIAFYNGGNTKTRTYDIYLKTTANNTFANDNAWIPATNADRVFSGSVTMTAGTWTVIEFDIPFTYDGTSNLAVIIDDNTGDYTPSPHMACRVYSTTEYQAIYKYRDDTDLDPANPNVSGTRLYQKNQIKFNVCNAVDIQPYTISVSANPAAGGTATSTRDYGCHYTVTATPNDCYRFVNWTEGGTEVSTDATYSFTATSNRTLVANFEIRTVSITCGAENLIVGRTTTYSVSGEGLTDGQVTWSYSGTGSVSFSPTTGLSTTVTATGAGSGTITATISSCGGSVHTCTLSMIEVCDDPDTANVGDHSGTETHAYLPSHSNYRYALSQQIYKPCEIGKRGTITSISFFNAGSAKTRTYDIYLKTTANNTFANTTAWIPVTAADRVFSGSVAMAAGAWTVIEFDLPFAYDGTSNLAVIMDDNTGSYSSGMLCRVYNADGNQAIYICSDGTNYNPLTDPITYSGTLTNKKNQIKFSVCDAVDIPASNYTVTVSANPTAGGTVTSEDNKCDNFTVTATPNDCYRFMNWTEGGTEVSTDATYSFTATSNRALVANFEAYSLSLTSDPDPLTCLASGTEVVLTASTDIPAAGGTYAFTNTTSSFSSISGSPDGTSINTGDYATYAFSLPFDFILAGKSFASGTTLTMRCDGFVTFGSTWSTNTPSGPGSTYSVISPLGYDQNLISGESYMYYKVTGSVGSRVLTMEWKNMRSYFNTSSQYNWTNYQVKLYECSNMIELCYGSFTHNYTSTSVYIYLTADGKITNLTSITSPNISTNSTGTTSSISIGSAAAAPANGTVYRFTPPAPYTWTYTGTAGTANCATYTASPTQNSSYTVSVSGVGCTKSASVDVFLQLEATIEFGD